ncbi:unnamed protein product [Amoebophrya sp. A120]|nr:unnamed protein product [Amoebophrya sp. A120]|eukprot:GSA120T00002674001.1
MARGSPDVCCSRHDPRLVFDSRSPRKPISVTSGLPVSPSADHEQFVLCCFRDQSFEHVDGNRNQEKNADGSEDVAAVDRAFAALMDPYSLQDLRVVSLIDCDVQKRTVSTPTTGQSERVFWLSMHDHNSWDVEVNREAFLHYEVIDCAENVAFHRRGQRAAVLAKNRRGLREEDIPDFDTQCVMEWLQREDSEVHGPRLGFLAGLSEAQIYRKSAEFVQRARRGEKMLQAVVGFGDANFPAAHASNTSLSHELTPSASPAQPGRFHVPLASLGARLRGIEETTAAFDPAAAVKTCFTPALNKFECVNQEMIEALLDRTGGTDSMVLPFLPGAPQSATDYALEDFFWEKYGALANCDANDAEAHTSDDEELPGVATALLTMCAEEGLDVDTVIEEAAQHATLISNGSDEVDSSVVRACTWLHDPAIRLQQEKRATQVQRDWYEFRHGKPRPSTRALSSDAPTARAGEDSTAPAGASTSTARSSSSVYEQGTLPLPRKTPTTCRQKISDALRDIGKKVLTYRKTVKHLRTLTKLGLLNLESELVRRNVRGSHITYHGPGGAATIVRNHRATAPMTSKQFVEKAQQLGEVGGERGGG